MYDYLLAQLYAVKIIPKYEEYAQLNALEKCLKICHIFGIQNEKNYLGTWDFVYKNINMADFEVCL